MYVAIRHVNDGEAVFVRDDAYQSEPGCNFVDAQEDFCCVMSREG